jgi:hypothetical protein
MSSAARDLASFSAGFTPYSVSIDVTTTTTENILANAAASGVVVKIVNLTFNNSDGSVAFTGTAWRYDQDGTGMNSNTGRYQAAIGADTVAGSAIAEITPASLSVAAGGAQVIIDESNPLYLHPDESIVIQFGAANDGTINLTYLVET